MPVWHEVTKELRAAGELEVVGIAQEQHAERTQLFAQWHGIDWPILWDPFNLNGSKVVPRVTLVDEFGIVRATRAQPDADWLRREFLEQVFEPRGEESVPEDFPQRLIQLDDDELDETERRYWEAISHLLWSADPWKEKGSGEEDMGAVHRWMLELRSGADGVFRYGVAHRMRHDAGGWGGDFALAIKYWRAALEQDPAQYIWRRRIQQYGPRLDKPYPFYPWMAEAEAAIRARAEEPVPQRVALAGAELAEPARSLDASAEAAEPDPRGLVPRDEQGFLWVDSVVVPHTSGDRRVARVHLILQPNAETHWNNEVEPLRVWIAPADEGDGWSLASKLLEHPLPDAETSTETRRLELELGWPATGGRLAGYVLFHACEGEEGRCQFLRHDFTIEMPADD